MPLSANITPTSATLAPYLHPNFQSFPTLIQQLFYDASEERKNDWKEREENYQFRIIKWIRNQLKFIDASVFVSLLVFYWRHQWTRKTTFPIEWSRLKRKLIEFFCFVLLQTADWDPAPQLRRGGHRWGLVQRLGQLTQTDRAWMQSIWTSATWATSVM